jgi:maltose/moltooligosaccharide transporter
MYKVKEPDYKSEKLQDKKSAQKSVTLFKRGMKVFQDLGRNVKESSPQFRKFCFYQTLTWLGIFIFWLYFTIALAQNMYSLPIILHIDNPPPHYAHVLQEANLSASLYLSIYQYVSVIYALLLFFALKNTEKTKLIHGVSLLIGGAAMAVLWVTHTKLLLVICMIGIGVMWGSIVVMPYAIVSQILPKGKFGTYLGIFNISITIPQIISGLTLSPIYVYIFKGHAPYVMLLAGVLIMMSALFWLKESYRSSEISFKKKEEYFSDKVEIPMEK